MRSFLVIILVTGLLSIHSRVWAAEDHGVKYNLESRKASVQVGAKAIDERLVLETPVNKDVLSNFLLNRSQALRSEGFEKIFIYAYPSKEALAASPMSWVARADWMFSNGAASPSVTFNDEALASIGMVDGKFPEIPAANSGNWSLSENKSPMDDSRIIFLSLNADAPIQAWMATPTPVLWIRCKENKTSVYVQTGAPGNPEYGEGDITIRLRFDKGQPLSQMWSPSTDNQGLIAPNAISLAKQMAKAQIMIFEFTPFNSSPAVVTFNLSGLSAKLPEVAQACRWKL